VAGVVGPLREAVGALAEHIAKVETTRVDAYAGLREQVAGMHRTSAMLTSQTTQLVTALRAPQVRGRWGELQLERVVELAGMVEHCDFSTQVSTTMDGADGPVNVRPDMVVRLANNRQVVVDAKVPFVPGDPFLEAALTADPALLEHAFTRNVVIATPTTLIALLRTVAHTWRQESLSRDAAAIHALGRELHGRLVTVGGHLDKLGAQLGRAVDSFNSTVSSMESRVLVTARKLSDLQVSGVAVPAPAQIDRLPRRVVAAGLQDETGLEDATAMRETSG
jgi:DNA recombination protein RmuC